jgi:hypothetical protein
MMDNNSQEMFGTEVLSLFSGTPVRVADSAFRPAVEVSQGSLAACRVCLDTGVLKDGKFCICEAGARARQSAAKVDKPAPVTGGLA